MNGQTTKASPKGIPTARKEISLYRSFDSANETAHSTYSIHRTGTTDHSVFYRIPHRLKNLKVPFSIVLSEKLPFGVGLGFTIHEDVQGTAVEVTLISAEHCKEAVATLLFVEYQVFTASPAVHPDRALLKVQGWFSGNGYIYLERPPSSEIKFDPLTYKIPFDGDHSCLGTWSKMDKHCIYCKAMGHIRKDCPSLPTETRTCFVCNSRGHIARNCPKVTNPNQTASKRRRPIPLDSSYEAPVTVLSRPVETLSSTAPPISSVPVLHEIPATSEEVTSAPTPNYQPAVQMPSAGSSVEFAFFLTPVQENVATQPILDHTTSTEILSDVTMDDSDNESMVSSTPYIKKSAAKTAKNKTSINPTRKSSRLNKGQTGEKFHVFCNGLEIQDKDKRNTL
ncbi:hypothetical protein G6F70_007218 [Rhizopus microsporus]|nr:hypothetical protein G6F71_007174 [Rhizopus microsporus]KAG1196722.1 hypothetical protein G6F70_007218 [Rhizopus microsporus]KAG1207730.1 hypothetical protein G6F69_007800 [Rhizopus microsporus]KAG1228642.1 hypothetical protein G6F67_007686 [Rhizopus microsporus]KAG1260604.1 hypothetical protein G6F68_007314 [Rhizopus microsporus]